MSDRPAPDAPPTGEDVFARVAWALRRADLNLQTAKERPLRDVGVPAVISGAGPTVLAFTNASRVDSVVPEVGKGWHIHPLDVATRGARVMTGEPEVRA